MHMMAARRQRRGERVRDVEVPQERERQLGRTETSLQSKAAASGVEGDPGSIGFSCGNHSRAA